MATKSLYTFICFFVFFEILNNCDYSFSSYVSLEFNLTFLCDFVYIMTFQPWFSKDKFNRYFHMHNAKTIGYFIIHFPKWCVCMYVCDMYVIFQSDVYICMWCVCNIMLSLDYVFIVCIFNCTCDSYWWSSGVSHY